MTVFLLVTGILAFACNDEGTEPLPPTPQRVKITMIDVAAKEVYLHIAVSNPASGETVSLLRDNATVITYAAVADTNIADTALTQATTYQYRATVHGNTTSTTCSTIAVQTLAPTSHNYTWETTLLGDGNGSVLYDVAVISETLAYAVGEIYVGSDPLPYNLVKWNGTQWELRRVTVQDGGGGNVTAPMRGVFAFSPTHIWLSSGVPYLGDGQSWTRYHLFDMGILFPTDGAVWRIFGMDPNNVFFVGDLGTIASHKSGTWQRVESGTETAIFDIWGATNPVTLDEEVFCSAGDRVLRISNTNVVDSIWGTNRTRDGIWTHRGYPIYTSGAGVFTNTVGEWREINVGPTIYTNAIRGNALNDIFAAGDFGFLTHFNGLTWFQFYENPTGDYYNLAMQGNLVIAVGEMNARGLIALGRRN